MWKPYLELGMIVNEDKTKVICFSKAKDPIILDFNCAGRMVTSKESLKVPGSTIDHRLKWTPHIKKLTNRIWGLLCGLKLVRRKFTEAQTKVLANSHQLSVLYYVSPVWLIQHLSAPEIQKLESVHYRSLRLIIKDFNQRIRREWVSALTQRQPPANRESSPHHLWLWRHGSHQDRKFYITPYSETPTRKLERLVGYSDMMLPRSCLVEPSREIGLDQLSVRSKGLGPILIFRTIK